MLSAASRSLIALTHKLIEENNMQKAKTIKTKEENIKKLVLVGMFTALAYVAVLVFHIKVQFLTFEFKDAIMTIGAMICGPVYALVMSLVTSLIEFFTVSDTGIYGFIMNFVASVAFTFPAALIYKYKRNIYGAIIGTLTAVFTMTASMLALNLVITPYYYHMTVEGVANMIPTLLLPFNITKAVLNAGVVLLLYKPVSQALKRARLIHISPAEGEVKKMNPRTTVTVTLISALLIAASLVVFFSLLDGNISFWMS